MYILFSYHTNTIIRQLFLLKYKFIHTLYNSLRKVATISNPFQLWVWFEPIRPQSLVTSALIRPLRHPFSPVPFCYYYLNQLSRPALCSNKLCVKVVYCFIFFTEIIAYDWHCNWMACLSNWILIGNY